MAEKLSTDKKIETLSVHLLWPLVQGERTTFERTDGAVVKTSPVESILYFTSSAADGSKHVAFDTKNTRYFITIPSYGQYLG